MVPLLSTRVPATVALRPATLAISGNVPYSSRAGRGHTHIPYSTRIQVTTLICCRMTSMRPSTR